jgi:NADPH:quinone reductase-like Zn-dependent oxidoreductase
VIGYDVSGVVTAVGVGVRDFKVGDEVFYSPEIPGRGGSFAEYHVAEEAIVAHKPSNLSHNEAASIPLAGGTAYDALITRAQLQVGETVLIHGGSGGVGSLAVQIARAAEITKQLGAHRVIDYTTEDFAAVIAKETNGAGVNVVFDTVGGETVVKSIPATSINGRIVSIVNVDGNTYGAYAKDIAIHYLFLKRARYKLDALRALLERGQIKPLVSRVFPLDQVGAAQQLLEKGCIPGKIVIEIVKE